MTHKKTSLLIAAVAVMLLSATSAQAYYETWDGWFNGGYLYYGGYYYYYVAGTGGGEADDRSDSPRDTFYDFTPNAGGIKFVNSYLADTIFLSISTMYGGKVTGTSGEKEGSGTWAGTAIRRKNTVETTFTSVTGIWNTTYQYDCFDYDNSPPTYEAHWTVTGSDPDGLDGYGSSSGQRTSYTE